MISNTRTSQIEMGQRGLTFDLGYGSEHRVKEDNLLFGTSDMGLTIE